MEAVEPRAKRMYDIKVVSQPARRFMRAGGTRDAQPRGPLRGFGCISLCAKCVQSEPQPFLSVIIKDCQQAVLFCGVEAVEPRAKRMYDIKVVSQPARRFMRAGGTRDAQPRGPLRGFGCISLCAKCVQSEPQPFLSVIVNCQIKCNTQRDFVQTNLAVFGSAKLSLAWRL